PGDYDAFPTSDTFSSSVNHTFSPDGTHLLFTSPPREHEAWSTNYDIWRVAVDGRGKPENLTANNKAADTGPQFSPDGWKLAYRSQKKPGFEADRWFLSIVDVDASGAFRGQPADRTLLGPNVSIEEFVWDANELLGFTWDSTGHIAISSVALNKSGTVTLWPTLDGSSASLSSAPNASTKVWTQAKLNQPPEVMIGKAAKEASVDTLSLANDSLLRELKLPTPESVTVKGADDTPMQM